MSGSAQRLPVSIFCFTEGLCEGEQVVLKPVLAEVEQDTNEETPLASEAIFAEELAEATAAQGPGPARQVTALHWSVRLRGLDRASRWHSASWNDCFGGKGPKER